MKRNKIIFDLLFILCLSGVAIFIVKVINGYQDQIDRQDVLINEYSSKEDSLRTNNEELIKSLNKLLKESPVTDNGDFDVKKFIDYHNKLSDSISQLNWDLKFIKDTYGVEVSKVKNPKSRSTTFSIKNSNKLDSALMLLTVFRDRLKKENNNWTISTEGKSYDDLHIKFLKVNEELVSLKLEVNKLKSERDNYKSDYLFYKNLVDGMHKKGLIKIDTVGDKTKYTY